MEDDGAAAGAEPERNAGAMWAAATLRPARQGMSRALTNAILIKKYTDHDSCWFLFMLIPTLVHTDMPTALRCTLLGKVMVKLYGRFQHGCTRSAMRLA